MQLLVLAGDGIGPEITAATLTVLAAAARRFSLDLSIEEDIVGHASLPVHGTTVRTALLDRARAADGLILGPTATFDFKDPTKGEINPSAFFRKNLDLFANIRPSRTYPGLPQKLGAFDLVIARENTEGFYADRNMTVGNAEMLVTEDVAIAIRKITRKACARIARSAFELAQGRKKHVTIVHKANVLRLSDGMFLEECRKCGREFPDVTVDDVIVDAMMALLIRNPAKFDVIVTTNMFGDIISDMTAEAAGSLGLGGSLNASADYAMAQASHGSAPDIAGKNVANPFSLILSTAQLLAWHGRRKGLPAFAEAAAAIEHGIEAAIAAGEITRDIGGRLGTKQTGEALAARIGGT
ncbi:MAG TPA: isocitrate/isopropylmalate family dehydrogenase [Micropepsaceae bacterium]|nr:isocitrate/isopropylmalate family dehydrogenase [Micropepsaceae bacterium]